MEILARIRKGDAAEIRVTRETYMGRVVINIRVWCTPDAGGEMVPSRKGVAFDAAKLPELISQLAVEPLPHSQDRGG
ncbi:transcriptional coactivator p15/PC4 family protein [Paraburkholderia caballeronis]|uniref:transcriptional coactivator p15/PC4 family protein n=1 Tax=Paraburkholderia caballeronis TaxID=416943 RepID=UPI0010ED217D|nr:transcriptional coactivator p15/PC4 family protein [Paraburkholderia caballeronis]TDV16295.1 transcriptional coactivator p15 (PC4) [Paraburkholderia caballeronis]TDV20645.1 transcriptional coactivator p15 (PC4) [Paraburkholderia caballeronis]TDV33113.1 transcriptional coactivator p15 (PC4) [Paraburkholderia caballeronis]